VVNLEATMVGVIVLGNGRIKFNNNNNLLSRSSSSNHRKLK
jgi:hypothetical protein